METNKPVAFDDLKTCRYCRWFCPAWESTQTLTEFNGRSYGSLVTHSSTCRRHAEYVYREEKDWCGDFQTPGEVERDGN